MLLEEGVAAGLTPEMVEKTYEVLDAGIKALDQANKKGVQIVYGTDLLGIMHPRQLQEFTIRSKVIDAASLIRQATVNAANLFEMSDQIGQVKEGFNADLIVIDGNPLEEISFLTNPEKYLKLVLKEGQICFNKLA